MKNIHLIPTDKPSRLIYNDANQLCYQSNKSFKNDRKSMYRKKFIIYITNDEKIKVGDYIIELDGNEVFRSKGVMGKNDWCKKIILTTDYQLIEDGIQAIDDEFLEWFVKNPGCESVEVSYEVLKPFQSIDKGYILRLPDTDVLEKPKQDLEKEMFDLEQELDIPSHLRWHNSKPKQETLEEAAEKYAKQFDYAEDSSPLIDFIAGAKWQQERMYSEEDMREAFIAGGNSCIEEDDVYGSLYDAYMEDWFEQFKKK